MQESTQLNLEHKMLHNNHFAQATDNGTTGAKTIIANIGNR